MKVAIVSDYGALAGGITVCIENVVENSPADISYSLVTWHDNLTEALTQSPRWQRLYDHVALVRNGEIVEAISLLAESDIVFLHTSWNIRLLAIMVGQFCRDHGIPLITVLHTTSHSKPNAGSKALQEAWYVEILKASDRIVCVSNSVLQSIETLCRWKPSSVSVIENASRFNGEDIAWKRAMSGDKTITFIGRPAASKGIDDFVSIAKLLEDTDIKFVCNGLYPYVETFLGAIPPNLEVCHSLGERGMRDLFLRTSAVVATYRHSEGLPLVILEALSLGIPVLAYKSPGVTELLEKHRQLLFATGRFDEIASCLRAWAAGDLSLVRPNPSAVRHWCEAAREYVLIFRELRR